MKRVNVLPNVITAFGLCCGLFVIFKVNLSGEGQYELLYKMTLILILAGFADLLDGAIARAIKAESEFGGMFDSLADTVSFGVAPSVLLLKSLLLVPGSPLRFLALAGCMLYTVCGVLRLVRYNVKSSLTKKAPKVLYENKSTFIGLPIPAAAASVISPNLLLNAPLVESYIGFSMTAKASILSGIMIFIGYLMVSRFRFPSLKTIHFRIQSLHLIIWVTLFALMILYGLLYYLPILLFILSWGYIVLSLCLAFIRRVKYHKTKTLEDFEPLEEEEEESDQDMS